MTSEDEEHDRDVDHRNSLQLQKIEQARFDALNKPAQGPTLLWTAPAKFISAATGIASLSVRAGTKIGGWGVAASREATLRTLEVNRRILETILFAAGKNVSANRPTEYGRQEADNVLARWIETLHTSISSVSLLAAGGFFVTQATIDTAGNLGTQWLSTLNAVFGCTESSRAVAAIIALLQSELKKPGIDGLDGSIGTLELLFGVIGFLFLQRNGKRKTEIDFREHGGEVTIWDIVIDDRGFRADVVGVQKKRADVRVSRSIAPSPLEQDPDSDLLPIDRSELITQPFPAPLGVDNEPAFSDVDLQEMILSQLPSGSTATITSETLVVKTVKVEIQGGETTHIEPPPGMVMVAEHLDHGPSEPNRQTIVFRTTSQIASQAEMVSAGRSSLPIEENGGQSRHDVDEGLMMTPSPTRPKPVHKDSPATLENSRQRVVRSSTAPSSDASARETTANQKKKVRKPVIHDDPGSTGARSRLPLSKLRKSKEPHDEQDRQGVIKKALKSLSPTQSTAALLRNTPGPSGKTSMNTPKLAGLSTVQSFQREVPPRQRIYPISATAPPSPALSAGPTTPSHQDGLGYFTVQQRRRESTYSQTDTFSIHSTESRPPSPKVSRVQIHNNSTITKTKSNTEISLQEGFVDAQPGSGLHHRRSRSFVPSLYSMSTKHEEESIILAPRTPMPRPSVFENDQMITALATDGTVPGQFPKRHLVVTLRRYMRFASASYGSNFLKVFGLSNDEAQTSTSRALIQNHHPEAHNAFSSYTGLPAETVLLSSFLDSEGLAATSKLPNTFSPLIHYVAIDHESKAVVLSCRGTLGFEDLLTDMACDFSQIYWQGQAYEVHEGIRDSARRLLLGSSGNKILATIKASLEEFPDFGLVLCGHSLGGAVAAVLAIMISEPASPASGASSDGTSSFVTANKPRLIPSIAHAEQAEEMVPITLPAGRPIHVFAFGSPATLSPSLRRATRGLITTVVTANDIVPCLSLGTLHDFKAVARHLRGDINNSLAQLRTRIRTRLFGALRSAFFPDDTSTDPRVAGFPPPPENLVGDGLGEDNWAWEELVAMRALMTNPKLVPPGEVFVLESTRVFDRLEEPPDAKGAEDRYKFETPEQRYYRALGRPATRVQFKLIRDVESRFAEVRFGRAMFLDHSPHRYETALSALERGVCED